MGTIVGLVHLKLRIAQADSLKDKRRIIKGFKDRLANKNNVSVAEVDAQENHRQTVLAVAMVGSDSRYVQGALQKIVNAASQHRDMILTDHEIELL
ncbi:MAG: DUF503 domain-containing protein [Planctomycetes bacterium]|nr:DUF503 domain-containing protein [Planctomycetota bacterium]